jgi:hypothetical protein
LANYLVILFVEKAELCEWLSSYEKMHRSILSSAIKKSPPALV